MLIHKTFLQSFWILHASGSFFFPPQVHLKNKPVMISSISPVPWFWIFQQAVEQILLERLYAKELPNVHSGLLPPLL